MSSCRAAGRENEIVMESRGHRKREREREKGRGSLL